MNNDNRKAKFTSSQASRLIGFESRKMTESELKEHKKNFPKSRKQNIEIDGFAKPGHTYIEEVFIESKIDRVIGVEVKTQAIKWGSLMEIVLFNLLGMGYQMTHKNTIVHPKYKFWSGTPDLIAESKIGEIKCYYPKKFTLLSLCLLRKNISELKEKFTDEYWQSVSNAILCGKKRAEIIAYMPYKTELEEIIRKIEEEDFLERNGLELSDYYFVSKNDIETLPYLPDDCSFSNVNSFEFEIPKEDLILMENRMVDANKELQKLLKAS